MVPTFYPVGGYRNCVLCMVQYNQKLLPGYFTVLTLAIFRANFKNLKN